MQLEKLEPITVTIEEAIRITGIGKTTFYTLIYNGSIETMTIKSRRLVNYISLKNYFNKVDKYIPRKKGDDNAS